MNQTTHAMAGKTVLITGGTGGIGRATAIRLATMGARVGITGRDAGRTQRAAAEISSESRNGMVDAFAADMSSQSEVRRLAAEVLDAYPRLDVLINNVGGFWSHRHVTADGLEHTFALNHLAPFLLTNLLLDRLVASAPARIVTVSSGAQSMGTIDFDDLMGERKYSGQAAYNQSKLANVMFTHELARLLAGTGVALAQDTKTAPAPTHQRGHGMGRLQQRLGLSDDQVTAIKTAYQKHREEQKQAWKALATAQADLRKLALDGADTTAKAAEVQQLIGQTVALRVKVLQEIGPVLTPEQRAKFAEARAHRGMRHHGKKAMRS